MKKKTDSIQNSTKISIDTHQKTIFEINRLIEDKIIHTQEIIKNTISSMNQYKKYEIFSNSDVVVCISTLVELYEKSKIILEQISKMPKININEFSAIATPAAPGTNTPLLEIDGIIDELQKIIDRL